MLLGIGIFIVIYVFCGNFLFDFDVMGIGVQLYGYDQLMGVGGVGIFLYYCVYFSKIRVYIVLLSILIIGFKFYVIFLRNFMLVFMDFVDLRQMLYCKIICWNGGDGSKKINILNYCSLRRMYSMMIFENEIFIVVYNVNFYL